MSDRDINSKLERLEIELLLEAVFRYYGYDFRDYDEGAVRSRIRAGMLGARVSTVSRFQEKVLREPAFLERFLHSFSVDSSSLFSDIGFYQAFRMRVVPLLRTYPFIRIWHTGCSTGEQLYSLAILLHEEGIYQRCRIYATDLSEEAVRRARIGSYSASAENVYTANYLAAGGTRKLSDYLKRRGNRLLVKPSLKKNLVFSGHNLATDGSFNEFQVIVCRDILGNFNRRLRERVHQLIYSSLSRLGVLALGVNESLEAISYEDCYTLLDQEGSLYQKLGTTVIPSLNCFEEKSSGALERSL